MGLRRRVALGKAGLAALGGLVLALAAGCGGSDSGKGKPGEKKGAAAKPAAATPEPAETAGEAPTPKDWAGRVADAYLGALTQTVDLLAKTPPASEALPQVKAIRDAAIETLLRLGRQREAMASSARSQADSQLMARLLGLERTEPFKKFEKLAAETYGIAAMKGDEEKELQRVLASLKLTSRYAQFDVLRKQEPKEAERLGLK